MPIVDDVVELFSPLTLQGALIAAWALTFILLPVARWIWGSTGERAGTVAGVVASVVAVTAILVPTHGLWTILVIIGVPVLGWLSEFIGSRTGIPFGSYAYTDVLQPQIGHVPIIIPLAWLMMMPSSWAVGMAIAPESRVLQWVIAAGAFTAWDLFVDPQMVNQGFWVWDKKGLYVGIPAINFLGWFVVAFAITAAFALVSFFVPVDFIRSVNLAPLLAVFIATWLLQSIGHLVFWRLTTSGIVGFLGMGVFAAGAILRLVLA